MFLLLVFLAIIFCVVIIYLPYAAGLTTVEKAKHQQKASKKKQPTHQQYSGYVPPDEVSRMNEEEKSKGFASTIRDKVKLTSEDMPIKIGLNQEGNLRRRGGKVLIDTDPNNYDYDLDELIEDETTGEAKRAAAEYYAKEKLNTNSDELV